MYAIRDWTELYENAETKKRLNLGWVLVPNRHDSLAFCRLMAKGERGLIIFGVWNLVLQLASRGKQSRRGLLCSDCGEAYTAEDIAVKTRAAVDAILPALNELVELGWLIEIDPSASHAALPVSHAALPASHAALPADDDKQVSKKESKKERKPPCNGGGLEIPKPIDNQAFNTEWKNWLGHLKAKGTPSRETLQSHLEELTQHPNTAPQRLRLAIKLGLRAPAKLKEFDSSWVYGNNAEGVQLEKLKLKIKEL